MNIITNKPPTQKERLLAHFKKHRCINRLQGWDLLGILELPSVICGLKADGHNIKTESIKVINRYGQRVTVAKWHYYP